MVVKDIKTFSPASVAQLDACLIGDQELSGSAAGGSATFFHGIDHEIFSTVIFSLPLIRLIVLEFKTHQPLWVILCLLLKKGRKEIEEIVEKMKERDREERGSEMKVKK